MSESVFQHTVRCGSLRHESLSPMASEAAWLQVRCFEGQLNGFTKFVWNLLVFFPRNRPKDNHEIKDLINSFYIHHLYQDFWVSVKKSIPKKITKKTTKKNTPDYKKYISPSHLIPESTTRPRPPRPPRKGEALVFSTAQLPDITRRLAARRLVIHPW